MNPKYQLDQKNLKYQMNLMNQMNLKSLKCQNYLKSR